MPALRPLLAVLLCVATTGCAHATIEPGHRGLLFDPSAGGLHHEVLQPGTYKIGMSAHMEDFPVTYAAHRERVHTLSSEGLPLDLEVAVIERPIISELYSLETEVGPRYYDEVVGPEARSTVRGVVARTSITTVRADPKELENAIEAELRRRVNGKHVEISSVAVERVDLSKEIVEAVASHFAARCEPPASPAP